MVNEALKGILGFDPESGERLEDKSRLFPVDSRVSLPKDVQDLFVKTVNEGILAEIDPPRRYAIFPDRLLFVAEYEDRYVDRRYWGFQPTGEAQINFHEVAKVYFAPSKGLFTPDYIEFGQEGEENYGITIERGFLGSSLLVTLVEHGRVVTLDYEDEKFRRMTYSERDDRELRGGGTLLLDLPQVGDYTAGCFFDGNYTFVVHYNHETGKLNITVNNVNTSTKVRELEIPSELPIYALEASLFEMAHLKDPYNVDPLLDSQWKENPLGKIGIKLGV